MADDIKALADRLRELGGDFLDVADRMATTENQEASLDALDRAKDMDSAAAILDHLAAALPELVIEHRPMWVNPERGAGFTDEAQEGFDPVGCVCCFPGDGSWPCLTRQELDGLADLTEGSTDG